MLTYLSLSLLSKPGPFKRAVFRRDRKALVMMAKALHRDMSEAIAAGDKRTLARVCTSKIAARMGTVIDARPRGRRHVWELVRYNGRARIRDAKVSLVDKAHHLYLHQLVVSIPSRQRLVQYDDTPAGGGRPVPGSEKEMDLVENLVLGTALSERGWKEHGWRIIATINETTPETLAEDQKLLEDVEKEDMEKKRLKYALKKT